MRYIFTFIWSVLLVTLLNYVVGAIDGNVPFDVQTGAIVSVVLSVLVIIMAEILPDGPVSDH